MNARIRTTMVIVARNGIDEKSLSNLPVDTRIIMKRYTHISITLEI
jgi:hypothetical protein